MCFSAPASFAASAALLPAGVYCVRAAMRKSRVHLPLALVPLALSFQQGCEGFVWLGLDRGDAALVQSASVVYLGFAMAFWPFWIPFSILWTAPPGRPRVGLTLLAVLALAFSVLYYPILQDPQRWLRTEVVYHSIHYEFAHLPGYQVAPRLVWRLGYLLAVCVPLLAGSGPLKMSFVGGLALAASFVVSYLVFWYAFTSVWCFLAAVLALLLCYLFAQLPEHGGAPPSHPARPFDQPTRSARNNVTQA